MLHLIDKDSQRTKKCVFCEEADAVFGFARSSFDYGSGEDAVELIASIPAWECPNCGEIFEDENAGQIRHETVCNHLGVLNPKEIRNLRDNLGLTQEAFADLTDIGVASVKRWENGVLIQNKAMDNFMRVLNVPGVLTALHIQNTRGEPVFRTPISDAQRKMAERFSLRAQTN